MWNEMTGFDALLMIIPAGLEWVLVLGAIGALFFGVKKIPHLARSLGSATTEYEMSKIRSNNELQTIKDSGNTDGRVKLKEIADKLGMNHETRADDELRKDIQRELGRRETI
jgi:sec-independent protein translocase protein TatA